ncbi:hypothetical protein [Tenacibaculum finnmarkense]|uniref:hypothetical protein n=1 Tax=Tenacibaculum finnmarkense TaxID=2781243 RepID=UPI001E2860CC|nr:hypothetical protein [Tenacibaculum finnmarkense]MCD8402677.1 hypothetical protein [Tenacibaculum finnmarkense genomovar finnmarkense]
MSKITEIKEEKRNLLLKIAKTKKPSFNKTFFFAGHYSYLNRNGMRFVFLVSTTIVGLFLAKFTKVLFFFPYIAWIGYDTYRMESLVKKHNNLMKKRIKEIDQEIEKYEQHEKVRKSIGHTINFLNKFKKTI